MKARSVRQFRRFDGSVVEEIRHFRTDECAQNRCEIYVRQNGHRTLEARVTFRCGHPAPPGLGLAEVYMTRPSRKMPVPELRPFEPARKTGQVATSTKVSSTEAQ